MSRFRWGSIKAELGAMLTLAWPVVLSNLAMVGMGLTDLWMVEPLGDVATAGVGIGHTSSFIALIIGLGCAQGVDPFVTQAEGAGDRDGAVRSALVGMVWCSILCVPIWLFHVGIPWVLPLFRQPQAVMDAASDYTFIVGFGIWPLLLFSVIRQLLMARGVVILPLVLTLAAALVNLLLDGLWVQGWGGWFEPLGVRGVAWATTGVRWFLLMSIVPWLLVDIQQLQGPIGWGRMLGRRLLPVGKVAIPVGLQMGIESSLFSMSGMWSGTLGAAAAAAHSMALATASTAFMMALGISVATTVRVGNAIGADRDWHLPAGLGMTLGLLSMVPALALYLLFPHWVAGVWTDEVSITMALVAIMPIAGWFAFFDGAQIVAQGILRGMGDTKVPPLLNLISHWLVGLPVAYWLCFRQDWGLPGLWWGLAAGLFTGSVLLCGRVLLGRVQRV